MALFLGTHEHTVDSKGRIAVPARFRAKIEGGAVLIRGDERCLYVYPLETWEQKAETFDASIPDPSKRRKIVRRIFGMAHECELDAQGRIVVPASFREYAGLHTNGRGGSSSQGNGANGNGSAEALVIGARERFEIWSPAHWEAYLAESQDEELGGLPF